MFDFENLAKFATPVHLDTKHFCFCDAATPEETSDDVSAVTCPECLNRIEVMRDKDESFQRLANTFRGFAEEAINAGAEAEVVVRSLMAPMCYLIHTHNLSSGAAIMLMLKCFKEG